MKGYDFVTTLVKTKVLCNRELNSFDKFLIKNSNGRKLVGCEIGVLVANHAFSMINHVPIDMLYLIDSYKNYKGYSYYSGRLKGYQLIAKKKMYPFRDNVDFVEKKFQDALPFIPKELDFAYYDIYDDVNRIKEFFRLYYPLIKKGGVIGGANFNAHHVGVARTVLNFVDENNSELDGVGTRWWIKK